MIADFTAAGDQSGCSDLIRDTTPETWGQDIEVPDWKFHLTERLSRENKVGEVAVGHAANIVTPGAVISGCNCLFLIIELNKTKHQMIYNLSNTDSTDLNMYSIFAELNI